MRAHLVLEHEHRGAAEASSPLRLVDGDRVEKRAPDADLARLDRPPDDAHPATVGILDGAQERVGRGEPLAERALVVRDGLRPRVLAREAAVLLEIERVRLDGLRVEGVVLIRAKRP